MRILSAILIACALPATAFAADLATESTPIAATWLTAPTPTKWLDARMEPTVLVRTSIVASDHGPVSVNGVTHDSNEIDPSQFGYRQGFVLENAQLGVRGRFNDPGLFYALQLELVPRDKAGNRTADYVRDAYIGWNRFSFLEVRLGYQKVAISQANLKATAEMLLPYAPTFDTFTPLRQLGLTVALQDPAKHVKLTLGAFDSTKQASEQMQDPKQLMLVGRAELNIDRFFGEHAEFAWRVAGNFGYTEKYFDDDQQRMWMGADTRAKFRFLELEAELMQVQFKLAPLPDGSQQAHSGLGWHVDLTGWLWADKLSLTGRFEQMDGDTDPLAIDGVSLLADSIVRQKKQWVTVGLGYTLAPQSRCLVAYIHRTELEGLNFDNDSGQVTCHLAF